MLVIQPIHERRQRSDCITFVEIGTVIVTKRTQGRRGVGQPSYTVQATVYCSDEIIMFREASPTRI